MSVALVTGASRGIGSVICEYLAKAGYDVAVGYSGNSIGALETVEKVKKCGRTAVAFKADVANAEEVVQMIKQVNEELGTVEVLVNNAGVTKDGLLLRMSEEDFDTVVDTNLKGTFLCTKAVLKSMLKNRCGCIINVSSVVGLMGNAGQANYVASKAGIVGFTKAIAKEYGAKGIRVNAVAPGFIMTKMTEELPESVKQKYLEGISLKRFGTAEDIAKVVSFLAGDAASYITGQVITVDGGMYC